MDSLTAALRRLVALAPGSLVEMELSPGVTVSTSTEAAGYLSALEGAGVVLPPRLDNPEPIVKAVLDAGAVE